MLVIVGKGRDAARRQFFRIRDVAAATGIAATNESRTYVLLEAVLAQEIEGGEPAIVLHDGPIPDIAFVSSDGKLGAQDAFGDRSDSIARLPTFEVPLLTRAELAMLRRIQEGVHMPPSPSAVQMQRFVELGVVQGPGALKSLTDVGEALVTYA
jgi:hypothetical protein